MYRTGICLLLFMAGLQCGRAQTLIGSGTILSTARQDPAVDLQGRQIDFMQENVQNLPFVERISVRTETDRFELRRQEYLTRLNVNGFSEMRRQRQLQQADRQVEESRQRVYFHEALLRRYELAGEWFMAQRELETRQQLVLVYEDQVKVLRQLAAQDVGADVTDLMKAEFDRDEMALKTTESQGQIEQYQALVQSYLAFSSITSQLDTSGFIGATRMEQIIEELPQTVLQNPEAAEKQAKMGQISAEYALEKAQSQKVLDFFQVRYNNRPDEALNRDLSVGFGINLPYKGSSKVKMNELKIERQAADFNLQRFQASLAEEISMARQQIRTLGERHRLAQQQWLDSQARFTREQASGARGPLPLLKAREGQLKRQLLSLDIEKEMFSQYLKILDLTGMLSETPLVNYLSSSLSGF